jgi:predicted ABC-type ATPase
MTVAATGTFLKPTGILIVNPDELAKRLSQDAPDDVGREAARVADARRRDLAARGGHVFVPRFTQELDS